MNIGCENRIMTPKTRPEIQTGSYDWTTADWPAHVIAAGQIGNQKSRSNRRGLSLAKSKLARDPNYFDCD